MELKDYIETKNISLEKAAKELDISKGYLYELIAGRTEPGKNLAFKIVKWSENFIKLKDLWEQFGKGN